MSFMSDMFRRVTKVKIGMSKSDKESKITVKAFDSTNGNHSGAIKLNSQGLTDKLKYCSS